MVPGWCGGVSPVKLATLYRTRTPGLQSGLTTDETKPRRFFHPKKLSTAGGA
jgi:hypothetical protein